VFAFEDTEDTQREMRQEAIDCAYYTHWETFDGIRHLCGNEARTVRDDYYKYEKKCLWEQI
jgi:hypothetical protein